MFCICIHFCKPIFFQNKNPNLLNSARGRGTFCAIDCSSTEIRDKIIAGLRNQGKILWKIVLLITVIIILYLSLFLFYTTGVQAGGCGDKAIRFRPTLVFQPHHANIFFDKFETVLKSLWDNRMEGIHQILLEKVLWRENNHTTYIM